VFRLSVFRLSVFRPYASGLRAACPRPSASCLRWPANRPGHQGFIAKEDRTSFVPGNPWLGVVQRRCGR